MLALTTNLHRRFQIRKRIFHLDRSPHQGFTVVEALIALGLFTLLIPSVVGALSVVFYTNVRAKNYALMNMIAENKVESLRSAGFNSLSNGTTSFNGELPSSVKSGAASYTITSPSVDVKQIDLAISYSDFGTTRTLNYTTFVSEIGVSQ